VNTNGIITLRIKNFITSRKPCKSLVYKLVMKIKIPG
jgi:hypothetical protein